MTVRHYISRTNFKGDKMRAKVLFATIVTLLYNEVCFASPAPAFPHANMMLSDICIGIENHYLESLERTSVSFTESYKKLDFAFSTGASIEILVDYRDSDCEDHKRISLKKVGNNIIEGRGCIVKLDGTLNGLRYKLSSPTNSSNELLNDLKVVYHCDPTGNKSPFITSGLLDVGRFNLPKFLENNSD